MNETDHIFGSSNLASRMLGELGEYGDIADLTELAGGPDRTVFAVVMDNGQRFKITVEQDD